MKNDRTFKARIFSRVFGIAGLSAALLFAAGCHHNVSASGQSDTGQDPATANLAPANGQTQVLGENSSYAPQQQGENYPEGQQAPAPIVQGAPNAAQNYPGGYGPDDANAQEGYDPNAEQAGEEAIEETDQAPPPLPEYDQPPAPGPDYLWTPGYWAWGPEGYYWVPGAWVEAPYYGALWTPPWWGWYGGHYRFHHGYWGPHVGYYGGIDYGFGYIGIGYFGGYWNHDHFYYNRAVTHVGGGIHDYYDRPVVYDNHRYEGRPSNRVSYNGGRGGINRAPLPAEIAAGRERHVAALPVQRQVQTSAGHNRSQFFNQNHGRPASAVETRGFANPHGIAPTPRGVQPGRPGMPAPNAVQQRGQEQRGVTGARPGEAPRVNGGANPGNRGAPEQRGFQPGQPNNQMRHQNPATPQNRPTPQGQPQRVTPPQQRMENRPGQPAPNVRNNRAVPQQQQRMAPQQQQRMAQPRVENRPAPQPQQRVAPQQQRMAPQQQRMAPQQQPRVENRPAPQQRMEAPRAAPQSRPAPQQRVQAPRPAPQQRAPEARPAPQSRPAPQARGGGHPAPQPRGNNDHPQGNEHGHR